MKKFILLFIILFNSSELFGSYFCNNIREFLQLNKSNLRLFNFNHYYYFKNYYSSWAPQNLYYFHKKENYNQAKKIKINENSKIIQYKNNLNIDNETGNQTISSQLSESSKKIEENFIRILNEQNTKVVFCGKILGHDEPVVLNLKQNCNLGYFVLFPNN